MKGLPKYLRSRKEWEDAVEYAYRNPGQRQEMVRRLEALKDASTMLVLSSGAPTDPEEQTPEHFEPVYDHASPLVVSGLSTDEINAMINRLGGK